MGKKKVDEGGHEPMEASSHDASEGDMDLAGLVKKLGPSSWEEAEILIEGVSLADRVTSGRNVITTRIDDDAVRLLVPAALFMTTEPAPGSPDPRHSLALTVDVIRIAAWCAHAGQEAYRTLTQGAATKSAQGNATQVAAQSADTKLRAERDQLAETIRSASGGEKTIESKVFDALHPAAAGASETGPDASVASLIAIAEILLKDRSEKAVKRQKLFKLDAARVASSKQLLADLKPAIKGGEAPKTKITQDAVDLYDGTNLLLLDAVLKAFKTGHATNPLVPKLGVVSLRGVLTSRPKKAATKGTPGDGGSGTGGTAGGGQGGATS